jgi:phosphoribosylformylglycinamidine cyclo-ligase
MEIYVPEAVAGYYCYFKIVPCRCSNRGRVEAANTKKLTISSKYGTFEY